MKDVKAIIAKNLAYFRKQSGLTQAELAEKLNYSDKAVSRWEHGDTLPDINVLYQLCDFYGIDMNTLVREDADMINLPDKEARKKSLIYRICIHGLVLSAVWIVATIIFLYSGLISNGAYYWLAFIWAIPASCLALNISSHGMKARIFRLVINSIFVWSILTGIFLTFLVGDYILWPIYLVGIPLQLVAVVLFLIKK